MVSKVGKDKLLELFASTEETGAEAKPREVDPRNLAALESTLRTLAPHMFKGGAPSSDQFKREAPPTLFTGEEEVTASSVKPRPHSGTGVSAHQLRADLCRERKPKYDAEELEAMEYESKHANDLDIDEGVLAAEDPEEIEAEEAVQTSSEDYIFDLIADQAKDNMDAFVRARDSANFARSEDLWHERYRHDAHSRQDTDELKEHSDAQSADRAAAERAEESRRAAAELADRIAAERRAADAQRAADDYARRLAEDRNRR